MIMHKPSSQECAFVHKHAIVNSRRSCNSGSVCARTQITLNKGFMHCKSHRATTASLSHL